METEDVVRAARDVARRYSNRYEADRIQADINYEIAEAFSAFAQLLEDDRV